jgi:hypothetical protein
LRFRRGEAPGARRALLRARHRPRSSASPATQTGRSRTPPSAMRAHVRPQQQQHCTIPRADPLPQLPCVNPTQQRRCEGDRATNSRRLSVSRSVARQGADGRSLSRRSTPRRRSHPTHLSVYLGCQDCQAGGDDQVAEALHSAQRAAGSSREALAAGEPRGQRPRHDAKDRQVRHALQRAQRAARPRRQPAPCARPGHRTDRFTHQRTPRSPDTRARRNRQTDASCDGTHGIPLSWARLAQLPPRSLAPPQSPLPSDIRHTVYALRPCAATRLSGVLRWHQPLAANKNGQQPRVQNAPAGLRAASAAGDCRVAAPTGAPQDRQMRAHPWT